MKIFWHQIQEYTIEVVWCASRATYNKNANTCSDAETPIQKKTTITDKTAKNCIFTGVDATNPTALECDIIDSFPDNVVLGGQLIPNSLHVRGIEAETNYLVNVVALPNPGDA